MKSNKILTYKEFREKNPKFSEPYQETEEVLWNLAQLSLLDTIESMCYGMVVNGTCQGVLTEKQLKKLKEIVKNG